MFEGMQYVYEVYKERSFSKAAQNLYISQPSLSATIKKIETRIGTPIFDRSTNPIGLTECGAEYLKSIEKIMDIKNEFSNYLNDFNELKIGQISVGASNYFASYILPTIITAFAKQYPLVKVNLTEANTPLLEEQLFSGSLDFVIDYHVLNDSVYTKQILCKEHLLLAVPQAYSSNEPAAPYRLSIEDIRTGRHLDEAVASVPLHYFSEEPFLFLRSGNDTRKRAERICQAQDFLPKIILKLDQQVTAFNLAGYGMGITFASDSLIQKTQYDGRLIYYKLGADEAARTVYFYHKHNRYITRAMEEFLKIAAGC